MNKIRMIILGAPGSGKGTISKRIVKAFPIIHVSTGDVLRNNIAAQTELGKIVQSYVSNGKLVTDDIMNELVAAELQKIRGQSWLLDGYPRTLDQVQFLAGIADISSVINLVVPFSVIIDRLKSRWIHESSGRIYNIGFNDPKIPGLDDQTGEPLIQREDDKAENVRKRLQLYENTFEPIVRTYTQKGILKSFHGETSDEIWKSLQPYLSEIFK